MIRPSFGCTSVEASYNGVELGRLLGLLGIFFFFAGSAEFAGSAGSICVILGGAVTD